MRYSEISQYRPVILQGNHDRRHSVLGACRRASYAGSIAAGVSALRRTRSVHALSVSHISMAAKRLAS